MDNLGKISLLALCSTIKQMVTLLTWPPTIPLFCQARTHWNESLIGQGCVSNQILTTGGALVRHENVSYSELLLDRTLQKL
ncbi:hypothetical protein QTG54_009341 [Skeletonema marinoi]|uniref:Uncharacterized protein n=1 Tax=Skeletonema marinoi TaxID=267567 RepID=A0AAD8Y5U3_9STRA|nr:hypothetical protein QTG54_009341 [Skeletonema marinoi]